MLLLANPKWRLPAVLPRIQIITSLRTKNWTAMVFTSRWLKIGPRFGRSNFWTPRRLNFRRVFPCEQLQSWTKVLGTVLQYSYFSVILGSLIKQCILFEIFLQFSLPPPYAKLKLGKKFWMHASNIVCGVRGAFGPVWSRKRPRNAKVSQDFCPWL